MSASTKSTQRKRDAAKYLYAARLIQRGKASYACRAIAIAERQPYADHKPPPLVARFVNAMGWEGTGGIFGWFGLPWGENQMDRMLALCFMAAMVEAGDA